MDQIKANFLKGAYALLGETLGAKICARKVSAQLFYRREFPKVSIILYKSTSLKSKTLSNSFRALVALTFLFLSGQVFADFTSAMVDYDAKKFPQAMEEFKRLASLGHKESQQNIGVMYFRGEGVDKNLTESYAWLALASSDGNADRGRIRDIVIKKLDEQQKELAFKRAEELLNTMGDAALKEKYTPELLADMDCQFSLKRRKIEKPIFSKELRLLRKDASVDLEFTIDKLGYVRDYSAIFATDKNFISPSLNALKYWQFEPYIVNGAPTEVAVKQIRMKYHLEGIEWDKEKVKNYVDELRIKAESGTSADRYAFAYVTSLISELRVERRESNNWFLKAAQEGLADAQYEVGKSLFRGEGCKTDVKKGIEWLTLAARANNPQSQYFLGVSMLGSEQFKQNKAQAVEWLNHAAVNKHAKAGMRLAWILSTEVDESFRDPQKALILAKEFYKDYADKLRSNETLAAAQAANNLYDAAIKSQKLALEAAKEINYPLDNLNKRLMSYEQHQPWRE